MKKEIKLLSVLMLLLMTSCSVWAQAGKDWVTYTIDGGAFHHQLITINSDPKAFWIGAFTSNAGSAYLKIGLDDNPVNNPTGAKWAVVIAFNRVGTGTAKVNEPIPNALVDHRVYFLLKVETDGKERLLMSESKKPAQTPGTITITKVETIGGTAEGTFEGKLIDNHITYTITGGHFVATVKDRVRP
ncbi:hypothetical protein [Mucilaginibacter lappiensis]|uniref:Lipid-binding hydrolase n=1 Tax=Mucilaginibacter lappiensis TaxID=354630 RepID=A0A841J6W6_9SPHI|nr:hypothetical protein [Mucilaginibacter lappiensis]MBB6126500.1 hypothetical protein [Mucilaginibacter lappiensis]